MAKINTVVVALILSVGSGCALAPSSNDIGEAHESYTSGEKWQACTLASWIGCDTIKDECSKTTTYPPMFYVGGEYVIPCLAAQIASCSGIHDPVLYCTKFCN